MDRAACHGSEHPPPPPDRPLAARGSGRKPWHILGENGWRILTENLHPRWATPSSATSYASSTTRGDVEMVVYNRAVLLFFSDSEAVKRIHEVCCRLDDIAGSRRPA